MAPVGVRKAYLFINMIRERKRRRILRARLGIFQLIRKRWLLKIYLLLSLFFSQIAAKPNRIQSCRRVNRNSGWWTLAWTTFSDARFKKTFRVSRPTFVKILQDIRQDLQRNVVAEIPLSPECRLGVCLYRLGRGDYLQTISELFGIGIATVHVIVNEVCTAIVKNMWKRSVENYFPKTRQDFTEKMLDMDEIWQFPYSWASVDGCHISIKCPWGGSEANKEYHNYKNFYSIVLMAMVDAKRRFVWASVGFPGNSHDAIIFQSTEVWQDITENNVIPSIAKQVGTAKVYPLILGDSAFPLTTWLMKPYCHGVPTPEERNFNYRLSRARMTCECAFGSLKSRWRVLYRKCECDPDTVKLVTLACIVLHNVCIEASDNIPVDLDLTVDPNSHERRNRERIRELLNMRQCTRVPDNSRQAKIIRDALRKKFRNEKQAHGVI